MNDIVMVNDANVESVIAADKPVILAIGASWCPDCRREPFTRLAAVNAERAVFASCDSEQNPQVVAKYAVQHIPTMVALKGGREVDRIVEVKTPGELKAFVERNI
ncbi:MAG: thioredoxin family protein [Sutterella wadsworthensis]